MPTSFVWLNGQILQNPTISALSAGLTLGWGVFTTVGIQNGVPRFYERHFARLQRDAQLAEIPFEWDFEAAHAGLEAVLTQNGVKNGLARLTVARRGDGRWNDDEGADFSIAAHETAPLAKSGLKLAVSPFRVEARRPLAGVKTTSYLPYFWAWKEAQSAGWDDALLLTGENWVCESARSNVFWLHHGDLCTPSLKTGCLDGLGRALVLEAARELGVATRECQTPLELLGGEAFWLVSAAGGVRSVAQVGDLRFEEAGELWRAARAWWEENE